MQKGGKEYGSYDLSKAEETSGSDTESLSECESEVSVREDFKDEWDLNSDEVQSSQKGGHLYC